MAAETAEAEAARNRPPLVLELRTPAEQMTFLVSTVQGMEKNIQEIMQNQKSLERVVETKFHNMDVKEVGHLSAKKRQLEVVHQEELSRLVEDHHEALEVMDALLEKA
ncbi:hypothetical protein D1007_39598 [Hordeum vulgare]|nr:hypothetical protein D1007_39598 [Hordeum vulgare]